jgi:hypothetical protein
MVTKAPDFAKQANQAANSAGSENRVFHNL